MFGSIKYPDKDPFLVFLHIVQAGKIFRFLMAKHLDLYVFINLLIYCIYLLLSSCMGVVCYLCILLLLLS